MKITLLVLGLIFGYGVVYFLNRSLRTPGALGSLESLQTPQTELTCPPQRFPGRVTFGISGPERYGTPNHYALTWPLLRSSQSEAHGAGPIPCGRNFTYNNDLTAVYQGQPPVYQTNCYQYPCLKSVSSEFTGTDVCWKCGDKPWAGPVREAVNCPPLKPLC